MDMDLSDEYNQKIRLYRVSGVDEVIPRKTKGVVQEKRVGWWRHLFRSLLGRE